jgi:hypothetical protein
MAQEIKLRDYYYYTDDNSYYYKQDDMEWGEDITDKIMKTWTYQPRVITHINGDNTYRAEFTLKRPSDCFSWESWKFKSGGSDVKFFCNDKELFELYSAREPIFYTKDGETRAMVINGDRGYYIQIYNMDGVKIKSDIKLGADCFVDFIQVSPKYAIGMNEEVCTYSPFGSIWDLENLMFADDTKEENFYSDHRTPITLSGRCICSEKNPWHGFHRFHSRYIPILARSDGFVVWDTYEKKQMDKIVSYEDAYSGDFDFDPAYVDPLIAVSQMCGRSVEELETEMFNNGGKLSFAFSHNDGPN